MTRTMRGRFLLGILLAAGLCGLLVGGCVQYPQVPSTYKDLELKASCERRGGWWRGDLIAGFCEFQSAQAP